MLRRTAPLLLVALLATACQLRLAADVAVESDGSGRLEVSVAVDQELQELLSDGGMDLRLGLEDAAAAAPDWDVEELEVDDGFGLRFATAFEEPGDLARLVDELHAGLDEQDGALVDALAVSVAPDGAVEVAGEAGLRLPATLGVSGDGVDVDAADLRRLLDERGAEYVRYDLRVTLPAPPARSDADEIDGRTLVWHLPVGATRTITARSEVPMDRTWLVASAAGGIAFVVAALTVVFVRRRRGRRDADRAEVATGA